MVKLASIDLGSNSTRILIADVNDEKFDVLERMHVVTKMSENIEQSKEISIEAYKRVDSALRIFKKLLFKNDVEDVFVVGTAALRDAKNAKKVIENIRKKYDFEIEVLSGHEERITTSIGVLHFMKEIENFLIVDSSLFISNFSDRASYVLGDETYLYNKPIEIHFGSKREDLSIYQRENGVIWKELPSINRNGQIFTFTEKAGYFRLGPKTIIVPEETDLHQNYPNPFNPSTTIKYDIGLMDGLEQRVSVNVYNVVGQHVRTLVNNINQVGKFYVKWDGADKFGAMLPSGIYFVQLKTDSGIIKNKKMMLLK